MVQNCQQTSTYSQNKLSISQCSKTETIYALTKPAFCQFFHETKTVILKNRNLITNVSFESTPSIF